MSNPVRVAVTGAAGQIGYSLLGRIACGDLLGPETPVILQLLEITPALKALKGVAMELEDLALPLLRGIVCTDDVREAFREVSWALLVGAKPRGKGMERGDLIRENGPIFVGQGRALNEVAAKDLRVVVVGNPCNTNALITMSSAPDVPRERFSAMTRLDENRARTQLAARAGVPVEQVSHVAIWGNHSATQFPDFAHARVAGKLAPEVIRDAAWLRGPFIETVQKRGAAVIEARGVSSAMSAANALIDHVRALRRTTAGDDFYSCAVCSPGAYGVPEGLISSFPVRTGAKGGWEIVKGIEHDDYARGKIEASIGELSEERRIVSDLLQAR